MNSVLQNRIKFSILNLFLVASLGVLMRYKIGFEFPYFDQKNLQHAHSHFAFYGWITHTLMTLMVFVIERDNTKTTKVFNQLILSNLIVSYGMLVSFSIGGYNIVSIIFSTSAIIISYLFTFHFIKTIRSRVQNNIVPNWFKVALLFNAISSLGTFSLAIMMATKHIPQHLYLASVYFFLHFQYNGWFFFASMGLLQLFLQPYLKQTKRSAQIFWMFSLSCVPAYMLSTLWMNLPWWLYNIVVAASIVQFLAWIFTLLQVRNVWNEIRSKLQPLSRYFLLILGLAVTIKFTLQLGSVIPFVSKLAFGFRPIVIAYLHLVLLAIISLFILFFLIQQKLIRINLISIIGFITFISGIYLTEVVLAIQGIASFRYIMVPHSNEVLFALACIMFLGLLLLVVNQFRHHKV